MKTINFKDFKSTSQYPIGSTIIDHKIRVKLGLTLAEYCIMDLIQLLKQNNEAVKFTKFQAFLGFDEGTSRKILISLREAGFISTDNNKVDIMEKWAEAFGVNELEYMEFATINGIKCWPQSFEAIRKEYIRTRKKYSHEYLIDQRTWYFLFLNLPVNSYRNKMGGAVWLGMKNCHFNDNWKEQYESLRDGKTILGKNTEMKKQSTMTAEEKAEMFK